MIRYYALVCFTHIILLGANHSSIAQSCINPGAWPAVPTITNVTTTSMTVNWQDVTSANKYRVYKSTNGGAFQLYSEVNSTVKSENVAPLSPGVRYTFYVDAVKSCIDGEGFPDERTRASGTVSMYTVPASPSLNIGACVSPSATSITFFWNGVACDGYYLNYSTQSNLGSSVQVDITPSSTTSSTRSGLAPGTNYYYQLRAHNATGISVSSSISTAVPTQPSTPTANSGTSITTNSFNASWQSNNGNATTYRLDVSTSPDFNSFLPGLSDVVVNSTSKSIPGLTSGVQYYYRVKAVTAAGASSYSSIPVITISPPPITLPPDNLSTNSFVAKWNGALGASTYRLDVATDISFTPTSMLADYKNISVSGTSQIVDKGIIPGTTYYYRVRTVNNSGTSIDSDNITVLTLPVAPTGFKVANLQSTSMALDWGEIVSATAYELEISLDNTYTNLLTGYEPKVIPSSTSQIFVEGLSPETHYFCRIKTRNASGVSVFSTVEAITNKADGSSATPQIQLSGLQIPGSVVHGQEVLPSVSANIAGGLPPLIVNFYHRKKTESDFTKETIANPIANTYKVDLIDSWLDDFGMDFYFEVTDQSGQLKREPTGEGVTHSVLTGVSSFTIPIDAFGKELRNYRIISFPYAISKTKIEDIFIPILGEYNRSSWRFVTYENGNNKDYLDDGLRINDISQGKGYWFISKDKVDLTFSDAKTYGNSLSSPFLMNLRRGWNQIGNPFPYDLSWTDVVALNSDVITNEINSMARRLIVFSSETVGFAESDLLPVFGGGFVFVESDVTLSFSPALKKKSGGRTRTESEENNSLANSSNWLLPIQVTQGEVSNTLSGIGMHSEAKDGLDFNDQLAAPRFFRYVELNSRKIELGYPLATDVVETKSSYKWNFKIESNSEEPVELKWSRLMVKNQPSQLILFDHQKKVLVNMAEKETYTTTANADISIYYGEVESFNSPYVELGKPYPNPFRDELTIPFGFSTAEFVSGEFEVRDLSGQVVNHSEIAIDTGLPGIQSVTWDGTTSQGYELKPGMYFYQLQINNGTENLMYKGKVIKQ